MNIDIIFGLLSGGLSLIAYGIYIYTIWRGNTRPSRSSWWILSIIWSVLFASSLSLSSGEGNWTEYVIRGLSVSYILGSLVIATSSIWRGSSEPWRALDYGCAILAGVAIILYFVFEAPFLSLMITILADFFGIIPTIVNAYRHPEHEHMGAWAMEAVASTLGLGTILVWNLSHESVSLFLPVLYLILINGLITYLVWRGQRPKKIPQ